VLESHDGVHNGVTWCSLSPTPHLPPSSTVLLIPTCYGHETRAFSDVMRRAPCWAPIKLNLDKAASSASAGVPSNHSGLEQGERSAVETARA